MKKIDVAHAVSIIANLGVIAGIIFLGYEIRQNTVAISGATIQAISEQSQQSAYLALEVPELQTAWQRAGRGLEYMTAEDLSVLTWYFTGMVRTVENRFRQAQIGTVYAEIIEQIGGNSGAYRHPFFGFFWSFSRNEYSEDFREWVDENLIPLVQEKIIVNIPQDLILPDARIALPRE